MPKELKVNLVNDGEGQISIPTEILKGKFDCLIVDSFDKLEIVVQSSLGYLILSAEKPPGVKYYAPRAVTQQAERNLYNQDQFTKFNLNEKLNITVRGPPNQKISMILRFD